MKVATGAVVAAVLVVSLGGCGGGSSHAAAASPGALLAGAKAAIDRAPSVHFDLTSSGAAGSGTIITGGSGDVARPDELQGQFTVAESGLSVSVGVLAGGGRFYVKLPFTTAYRATDPSTYGLGNPAQLIAPTGGLSDLLVAIRAPKALGSTRIGSEIVDQVEGTVPGASVPVLPDADRAAPVSVVAAIVPGSEQLRRITLRGPFTSPTPSTYTVVLTGYGEAVHVDLPGG